MRRTMSASLHKATGKCCTAVEGECVPSGHAWELLIRLLSVNWQHTLDAGRSATRIFALNLKADACPLPLPKLAHFSRGLLQPIGHAHFAVHSRRDGEVFLGLFAIASPAVKLAETEVAVSDLWTHAAGLS